MTSLTVPVTVDGPALRRALTRPGQPPPELCETHCSWVVLTADRAYKLKKPVRFAFVDQSAPEDRRALCEEEVRLNRELAGDVVLGVGGVAAGEDGVRLVDADDPAAVDWVVVMRRFDEADTFASRIAAGTLAGRDVDAVARRLAAFHAGAPVVRRGGAGSVAGTMLANLAEMRGAASPVLPVARLAALERFVRGCVARRAGELMRRAREGCVREVHGDLRAEHVLVRGERVTIVDRLEFDRALRTIDVGDDLAFLVMDLEACGARWAAERLLAAYREAGGDPGDDALVALFAVHRALVRAKVHALRAAQGGDAGARAARMLALAERCAWRARGPLVLVVAGPPASGKSTLARALADASGWPVVATDVVRKRGLAAGAAAPGSAYTAAARRRTYRDVGALALEEARDGGVIVDATFGDTAAWPGFAEVVRPAGARVLVVDCSAPASVRQARARRREAAGGDPSDAGPELADRLAEAFVPATWWPGVERTAVVTTGDPRRLTADVAAWLDGVGPPPAP